MLANAERGRLLAVPCRSWRCDVCAAHRRRQVVRRLAMGLEGAEHPRFLTLTSPAGDSPEESMRLLSSRFERLRRLVRQTGYLGEFEYGGVVELTRRGVAHFHVLFRGPYLTQRAWSRLAAKAGFGRVAWVEAATAGAVAGYVAKALPAYVAKDLGGAAAFPPHFRRVRFSRGWAPGWVVPGPSDAGSTGEWALVRPGTPLMSVYLRLAVLGNRADPDGWALEPEDGR